LTAASLAQVVPIETTWQDHVSAFVARYQSANTHKRTIQDLRTLFLSTVAQVSQLSRLAWTGKRNKPRNATLYPSLCEAVRQYLALYPNPQPTDPLFCPANCHSTAVWWHRPISPNGLSKIVTRKGTEAGISYQGVPDRRRTATYCTTPKPTTAATSSTCSTYSTYSTYSDMRAP